MSLILIKLAWRNIFRNKRRTFLTVSMMVFGYVLFSFFLSLADGAYGNIITQFINARTGEYQIHFQDYLDNPKIYKTISDVGKLQKQIEKNPNVTGTTARVKGSALSFLNKKTMGVQIVGFDVKRELQNTTLAKRLLEGSFPKGNDSPQIVIGKRVAETLKAHIGDQLALISSGADGSLANDQYEIVGVLGHKDSAGIDDQMVYIPLHVAQEFFSVWGRAHEIVLRTKKQGINNFTIENLEEKKLTLSPWQVVESDFYKAMLADKKGDSIARIIIMLMVALGVFNTVLMSMIERKREFGVLKAIGTKPSFLGSMIVLETMIMNCLSLCIGFIIALGLNYYFSIHGIEFEEAFEYGGFMFKEMNSVVNVNSFLLPTIVVTITSFVVSLFPAVRAAKITPVDALRD